MKAKTILLGLLVLAALAFSGCDFLVGNLLLWDHTVVVSNTTGYAIDTIYYRTNGSSSWNLYTTSDLYNYGTMTMYFDGSSSYWDFRAIATNGNEYIISDEYIRLEDSITFDSSDLVTQDYDSEGTTSSPYWLYLSSGSTSHNGEVSRNGYSYYRFTTGKEGSYRITLGNLENDADLDVGTYAGSDNVGNSSSSGTTADSVTVYLSQSTTYYVTVDDFSDSGVSIGTSFTLTIEEL